jgi:hypothetical protein
MSATKTVLLTPIKAIRAKCLDCSGGSEKEVGECRILSCALHPYRMGKRPATVVKYQTRQAEREGKKHEHV